jgi:Trypsin-like peptidase domain
MTARVASIAVGCLVAGTLAFAPQSDAKPGKGARTAHPKASSKTDTSASTHNAAPPGAETGVTEPQRLAIQADLVWLNNYGEMSAEEINAHLVDQIKAFQRRNNGKDTGVLTDQERAALADAVKAKQTAAGWRLIDDAATGTRLGVPEKLVPKTSAARTGSRWTSKGGQVQIETFRLREASLPALFDQEKRVSQREIGASNLEPNSFVMTGQQGLKKFVERVQSSGSEVRGVTVLYDQATEGTMAPIAIAVADTFDGFPDPTALPLAGRRRGVEYGSAVVVSSSGDLVTTAQVADECRSITVPGYGHAARIAADPINDLALLRLYGARDLVPVTLADDAGAGNALTLLGIADPLGEGSEDKVTRTGAQLTDQGINPVPKLGFSGAAAIDAQGRLAGVVELKAPVVAGSTAVPQATLVPAAAVQAFLQAQGITAPPGHPVSEQSVVRVICVRR